MDIQSVKTSFTPTVTLPPGDKTAPAEARAERPVAEARAAEKTPETRANAQDMEKEVREAVENIERFVSQSARDITFSIDKDDGFMVRVVDRTSQDVIRQIPSKEVIAIARALDKLQGLFVRDKI
ncbi:MAG: flagellar protein FlaG [Betaproteobacteria bacterium]|nr:flagellar protein FlaG [Betaproteobacteria bacterium]MCL2885346.1 flagellar protein FlaG [Betaproteobacteria bacterium]